MPGQMVAYGNYKPARMVAFGNAINLAEWWLAATNYSFRERSKGGCTSLGTNVFKLCIKISS
jgi:hypothetical protein